MVRKNSRAALTLIEVLVVVIVLAILVLVILPSLSRSSRRWSRLGCVNNLKQVALSFRMWSEDNDSRYPTQVTTTNGGAMESSLSGDIRLLFQVMSNELNPPKILCCPLDKWRSYATNFSSDFHRTNISYFVNLDATKLNPDTFLCGDRNLVNHWETQHGIFEAITNQTILWYHGIHTNEKEFTVGRITLYKYDVHEVGNIAFSDGHVDLLDNPALNVALQSSGVATNRLIIP
jgi:prepilin-type processing-associated H-X9-DG protein